MEEVSRCGLMVSMWIFSIPNGCIFVTCNWYKDIGEDSCNIEVWPLEHELVEQGLFSEVCISSCCQFFLSWDSSGIVEWVGLVAVVVCLD